MTTQNYVAGFLFSPGLASVALIQKNKPEWQAGKLNGIGGKIEEGETPDMAMRREFLEEAGMDISDWRHFCTLSFNGGKVYFYCALGNLAHLKTMTDELVRRVPTDYLDGHNIVPNLTWLIPMAMAGDVIGEVTIP